jgi:hypothetical protein
MPLSARLGKDLPAAAMRIGYSYAIALFAIIALGAGSASASASGWTLREPQLPKWHRKEGGTGTIGLSGVSCPTTTLCIAIGTYDTVAFSQAPTGDASTWQVVNPPPAKPCPEENPKCGTPGSRLQAVSCASQSLCVLASYEGFFYVSTDPTGPASSWSPTNINEPGGHGGTHLAAVSCPSTSLCVAVSGGPSLGNTDGKVITSTNPASGSWQTIQLAGSPNLRGVSCGTTTLCVAVAREGRIFVSTNPAGGASAWQAVGTPGGPGDLEGVSCVATSLCAAGNASGNILTSTNPSGSAAGWGEANGGASVQITSISCPTALRCVAVDNNGDVLTSTDPNGGASSWHFENLVPYGNPPEYQGPGNALFGASCASISLCALVGSEGRVFISTEPFAKSDGLPGSSKHRKVRKRPRTIILFAKPFWVSTSTRRPHIRAGFHFYSPTPTLGFECKRDKSRFRRCRSPLRYWVGHGRHALRVRAIGPSGLRGPAAIQHFRVTRPRAPAS